VAYEIIVVGTSWGGLSALHELIAGLPDGFGIPVVAVQHRHRQSGQLLASLLQDRTSLCVCEVEDKAPIVAGNVYVAPPDYHLLIEPGYFSLSTDEPVQFSRPSIDVTFVSAADTYGDRSVGVVLTGANADGSRGLKRIFDRGGLTFVQSPSTAESPMMPAAALRSVPDARAMSIAEIAAALAALSPPAESSSAARRSPSRRRAHP
jgi:two-component system, chemotaxis family, protein-glutamate methylesterase/glutaminase